MLPSSLNMKVGARTAVRLGGGMRFHQRVRGARGGQKPSDVALSQAALPETADNRSPSLPVCGENAGVLVDCCWETDVNTQKETLPVSCHNIKMGKMK